MCTLAIFHRLLPGLPLAVAANRDEFYRRPASGPVVLGRDPIVFGGQDLVAGGTWLALSERGLVVGVLNRRSEAPPDPTLRSRGVLCVELAGAESAATAAEALRAVPGDQYNPFNLLIADGERAFVAQNRRSRDTASSPAPVATVVEELDPGTHLLTNLDLNDPTCPRISRSSTRFAAVAERFTTTRDTSQLVGELRAVLADHATALDDRGPLDRLCIHLAEYGTRSSSIVLGDARRRLELFHGVHPPCSAPPLRVALPW